MNFIKRYPKLILFLIVGLLIIRLLSQTTYNLGNDFNFTSVTSGEITKLDTTRELSKQEVLEFIEYFNDLGVRKVGRFNMERLGTDKFTITLKGIRTYKIIGNGGRKFAISINGETVYYRANSFVKF